ncbi:DUF47 family protein [Halarchaeum salinum]|uniref:DUF47 family protein n=1 Tax=Halarchaeum salinum TaxID=489912 RepID=A0AAV3SAY1_9EURY
MASGSSSEFSTQLVTQTDTYLETIRECVDRLSTLVERYASGESPHDVAETIRALESECDVQKRTLSSLVTNTSVREFGIRNSRVHLNSEQLVKLYQLLDEIPNTAEQIAEDISTIDPPREQWAFQQYHEITEHARTAMATLYDAVHEFIHLLCSPTETGTITDHISDIRETESACDSIRNDIIAEAFEGSTTQPLLYREFANNFDHLVDTMEDTTDHLVLLSSSEPWITAEPGTV